MDFNASILFEIGSHDNTIARCVVNRYTFQSVYPYEPIRVTAFQRRTFIFLNRKSS